MTITIPSSYSFSFPLVLFISNITTDSNGYPFYTGSLSNDVLQDISGNLPNEVNFSYDYYSGNFSLISFFDNGTSKLTNFPIGNDDFSIPLPPSSINFTSPFIDGNGNSPTVYSGSADPIISSGVFTNFSSTPIFSTDNDNLTISSGIFSNTPISS